MTKKFFALAASLAAVVVLPTMAGGATGKVTLGTSPSLLTYGNTSTVSGAISTQQQNQRVVLQSRDCTSNAGFSTAATLSTGTGGTFSATMTPLYNTVYQAQWKNATSSQAFVRVRPKISFVKLGAHRYRVRVRAATNFLGHYIALERRAGPQHFVVVKKLRLRAITRIGPNLETYVSGRFFKAAHLKRGRIRVVMRDSWTGPCYAAGMSRVIHT